MHFTQTPTFIYSKQNVNFRNLSLGRKLTYICNEFFKHLQLKIDLLMNFIHKITKKSRDELGMDITQLKLLKHPNYSQLKQRHFDTFHEHTIELWAPKASQESLEAFKCNLKNPNLSASSAFYMLYAMTIERPIPCITLEDRNIARMLHDINKPCHKATLQKLTLRDIKVYYNLCVKCTNYAIQCNDQDAIDMLHPFFKIFQKHDKDLLQLVDQEKLKNCKELIELLQMLKPHLKYVKIMNGGNKHSSFIIDILIKCIVDGKEFGNTITYNDIHNLMLLAVDIDRNLRELQEKPSLEKNLYVLKTARKLGLISIFTLMHVQKHRTRNSNFSDSNLQEILSKHHLSIDTLRYLIERFPHDVYKTTRSIAFPFS